VTERRATITRTWRPAGAPARRIDDFLEVQAEPEPAKPAPERLVERRSIGRRLENWGIWANAGPSRSAGSDCMTGVICDAMRRHAVGELHPPSAVDTRIDMADAEAINRAITKIDELHRWVLHWTYVVCARPWGVAGACGFPTKEYGVRLGDAQAAIEDAVGGVGTQRASSRQ
jgi:hypothetical protein